MIQVAPIEGHPVPRALALGSFELLFSREARVLLVHYDTELSHESLATLDGLVATFVAREGTVDSIIDFAGVPHTDFPISMIEQAARVAPRMPGRRRVYVADNLAMFGICRLYGVYQEIRGFEPPTVARSLGEAMSFLGAEAAGFAPA